MLILDYVLRKDQSNGEAFQEVTTPSEEAIKPIQSCEADTYIRTPCYDFIYSPVGDPTIAVRPRILSIGCAMAAVRRQPRSPLSPICVCPWP